MTYTAENTRYQTMQYNRCGNSGVLLPKVSLGFWHNFGNKNDYDKSRDIVLTAFDNGITHFDFANNYGIEPGSAERSFGKIIKNDLKPYRDELFVSTKAGYDMWDGPYGSWCSKKHMISSLDQSLKRLKLDYVDLFYCHRYDENTPLDETLEAMVDIVHGGKALYLGVSRWPLEAYLYGLKYLKERHIRLLAYQGRYNIFDRTHENDGILDNLSDAGFVSFSPLAQGLLTDRYLHGIPDDSRMNQNNFLKKDVLTDELLQRLNQLNDLAKQRGQTLSQMALSWILRNEKITSVIVGVSRKEQLLDNIDCIKNVNFSEEELKLI